MIMSLGVHFSSYMAPHELRRDSAEPPIQRVKRYRAAAAWCLVSGKYNQPTEITIAPFILYAEIEFLVSRHAQMDCYLLTATGIRLMLKLGFHRDPSKLAHISTFEGEMRRRIWYMGVTLDLLVSFHMGLPAMVSGIDSDTQLPRNLLDDDFGPETEELPPARPMTEFTAMTYPVLKNALMRCFAQVARQAHALTAPSYSEVLRLDNLLQAAWKDVPAFMMVRPLEESVTDAPTQIIRRFGLSSIYNKSRCVLHRRYLVEPVPRSEHNYSRRQCLDAATTMLKHQDLIWHMCQPGNVLDQYGWFVSSLTVHDFLLSAMVVFLVIKNDKYPDEEAGFGGGAATPSKEELVGMLHRAYSIWKTVSRDLPEVQKTADIVETMLGKVGSPVSGSPEENAGVPSPARPSQTEVSPWATGRNMEDAPPTGLDHLSLKGTKTLSRHGRTCLVLSWIPDDWIDSSSLSSSMAAGFAANGLQPMDMSDTAISAASPFDPQLVPVGNEVDWVSVEKTILNYLDDMLTSSPRLGLFRQCESTYKRRRERARSHRRVALV